MRRALVLGPVLVCLAAVPGTARAANALLPRTPAVFPADTPCVTTIERGEVLHLPYAVPVDDVELTDDELPDSRTHQFFAFAEQRYDFQLPLWVNQADYDRAAANGDIVTYGDRPILDSDPTWPSGSWVRITPDDPRLPITHAQAALGVDWDTTDTPPGTWLVAAYTWAPEQNIWSPRFGAVRVVDPADPEATGPTVMLQLESRPVVNVGDAYVQPGCIEAPEGSTYTASWGAITSGTTTEPEWIPFAEDVPAVTGPLALEFVPPADAPSTLKLRVEITDPSGRSYVAYSPATIGVVGVGGDGSATDDGTDDGGGSGCHVAGTPAPASIGLALVVLFGVGLTARSRRTPPRCPARSTTRTCRTPRRTRRPRHLVGTRRRAR